MNQPERARPVLSKQDFLLLRTAVMHYARDLQDAAESAKYVNLLHRLGSVR